MNKTKAIGVLAAALGMATVTHATNITYTGSRGIGGSFLYLTITTDGTLGTLKQADILSWDISYPTFPGSYDTTNKNSHVALSGSDLSATATALIFNFADVVGGRLLIEGGGDAYTAMSNFQNTGAYEGFVAPSGYNYQSSRTVSEVLATAPVAAPVPTVPEPASWTLLLLGFGGLGAVLRSRRPLRSSAAR